jgi:hypothetical protein
VFVDASRLSDNIKIAVINGNGSGIASEQSIRENVSRGMNPAGQATEAEDHEPGGDGQQYGMQSCCFSGDRRAGQAGEKARAQSRKGAGLRYLRSGRAARLGESTNAGGRARACFALTDGRTHTRLPGWASLSFCSSSSLLVAGGVVDVVEQPSICGGLELDLGGDRESRGYQ